MNKWLMKGQYWLIRSLEFGELEQIPKGPIKIELLGVSDASENSLAYQTQKKKEEEKRNDPAIKNKRI